MADPDCLFCKIVAGEIPADIVDRTERVIAFRDLNPQAPTHVLVVPVEHYANIGEAGREGGDVVGEMAVVADRVGLAADPDGWRWVFNTGRRAGQVVFHVHGHVLAGRDLTWPPG
ncbi:MAG: HIT domain-containing protein [Actinomycetales bacterium]